MKQFNLSKIVLFTVILSGLNWIGFAQTSTFNYTGAVQIYTVPLGVNSLGIDARGGCGGGPYVSSGSEGPITNGGRVQCVLAVTGGEVLYLVVGQGYLNYSWSSNRNGGYNGGGAQGTYANVGGGASDVRLTTPTGVSGSQVIPYTSSGLGYSNNRLVVAGGGGGGGDFSIAGGLGGGLIGGTGGESGAGGYGGTSAAGGASESPYGGPGGSGGLGYGGAGYSYSGGGGGGGYYGGGGGGEDDGGGGGGSSYTDSILVTAVTHTQGYSGANGNGEIVITVLCGAPGTILGSNYVCTGGTTTLTNPTGANSGTWSSSNAAAATINPTTGVVSGVAPGTSTITYFVPNPCGGVAAQATFVITTDQAASIVSGTSFLCTGQPATITAAPAGGSWSSSNTAAATVVSTGTLTASAVGGLSGTANIIYTLPTGCAASDAVTVNVSPTYHTVTESGTGGYCAGNPTVVIGLNGSVTGTTYNLYNGSTLVSPAPVAGTGSPIILAPSPVTAPGTYTVVASLGSCNLAMSGSATVFLNPNPSPLSGASDICTGTSAILTSTPLGGTWSSSNITVASVGVSNGIISGFTSGTSTVTYTLAGGCSVTGVLTVSTTPAAISGSANVCVGSSTSLRSSTTGGTWSSSNTLVGSVIVTDGQVFGVSAGTPTITYTVGSGCYTTTPVSVNALPSAESITGGGPYCLGLGVRIGLAYAVTGINYQLYNGASTAGSPVSGAGSSLDFGLQYNPGTYTVLATNALTNCNVAMPGSTTISVNPPPNATYVVSNGGNYCAGGAGVPVSLSNSDYGISYQLMNGSSPMGSAVSGVGGSISFGPQTLPGTYTVVATTGAGCSATMTGSAAINITPLPNAYPVLGGGTYCIGSAGADVSLEASDIGTSYQLFNGTASASGLIPGTGAAIDFGLQTNTGSYTVVATSSSSPGCSGNMTGTAVVTSSPQPATYAVTGGGPYCSGVGGHVGLSYSEPGVSYQLYVNGFATGAPVMGSSASIDFGLQTTAGTYTVVAANASNCVSNMSGVAVITINSSPVAYAVTGGGSYCPGGTGASVGLGSSSIGVSYQLFNGSTFIGTAMTGTGGSLNFGLHTLPGAYTIVATNTSTGCTSAMSGSGVITESSLPTSYGITTASSNSSYCAGGEGVDILLTGSDIGTNYQLYKGLLPVGTSMSGTGASINFGYETLTGTYTIVANNPFTTCTSDMSGNIPVTIIPQPTVYTITGGGDFCMSAPGVHVGLSGSNSGVNYQLNYNGVPVLGDALAGNGVSLDFGAQSNSGTYTVIATNTTTLCSSNMVGSAVVVANAIPDAFALTGDGTGYCASVSGAPVGLSGSSSGISYQLYNGTAAVGAAVSGSGAPLSFGNRAAGTYTVLATNSTTGCKSDMPGSATISVNPAPAQFAVNGGGNTCSDGSGTPVGLDSSASGINYQLYYAGLPTSTVVSGTGSAINFGLQTGGGTYTAVGINGTTSCTSNMTGSVTITVIPAPALNNVVGGGPYCAGGVGVSVGLSSSTAGVVYQLYNGVTTVGTTTGTGSVIDFGLQTMAGAYTVIASPGGACQTAMSGSASVVINPLPIVDSVTGGGTICFGGAGKNISLNGSSESITYKLYNGSTFIIDTPGTGSSLTFGPQTLGGAYSVIAINNTTTCTSTMAGSGSIIISVAPLPTVYDVTGGGSYCSGIEGVHVELSGSNTDINYSLYNGTGTEPIDSIAGTGTALDFGLLTAGSYTVIGRDAYTGCHKDMADTAAVTLISNLTPAVSITATPTGTVAKGQAITFVAHTTSATAGTSPAYQWYIDGLSIAGAVDSVYSSSQLSNGDSVRCEITSSGACGGISASSSVTIRMNTEGVQQITSSGSSLSLLPNPNNGSFTIKGTLGTTDDEAVTIEITDLLGHVVYTKQAMSHNGNINETISLGGTLANAMYLVNLRSASAYQVFHMVIEQ